MNCSGVAGEILAFLYWRGNDKGMLFYHPNKSDCESFVILWGSPKKSMTGTEVRIYLCTHTFAADNYNLLQCIVMMCRRWDIQFLWRRCNAVYRVRMPRYGIAAGGVQSHRWQIDERRCVTVRFFGSIKSNQEFLSTAIARLFFASNQLCGGCGRCQRCSGSDWRIELATGFR